MCLHNAPLCCHPNLTWPWLPPVEMVSPIKSWILHQHAGSQDPPPSPRPIFHKLAPVWGVCGFGVIPNPNAWLFQQVQWWTMTVFADADCKFLQLVWQKDNHLLKDLLFVVIIVTDWYRIESLLGGYFFVTMVGNTATRGSSHNCYQHDDNSISDENWSKSMTSWGTIRALHWVSATHLLTTH